MIKYFKKPW